MTGTKETERLRMESAAASARFTPGERAAWAVAYASVTRTKKLSPALRKAYGDGTAIPDREQTVIARNAARGVLGALEEAVHLLDEEAVTSS